MHARNNIVSIGSDFSIWRLSCLGIACHEFINEIWFIRSNVSHFIHQSTISSDVTGVFHKTCLTRHTIFSSQPRRLFRMGNTFQAKKCLARASPKEGVKIHKNQFKKTIININKNP